MGPHRSITARPRSASRRPPCRRGSRGPARGRPARLRPLRDGGEAGALRARVRGLPNVRFFLISCTAFTHLSDTSRREPGATARRGGVSLRPLTGDGVLSTDRLPAVKTRAPARWRPRYALRPAPAGRPGERVQPECSAGRGIAGGGGRLRDPASVQGAPGRRTEEVSGRAGSGVGKPCGHECPAPVTSTPNRHGHVFALASRPRSPPKAARTSRRLRKAVIPDPNPSGPVAFRVRGDLESSGPGTFGAGTIIRIRSPSSWKPPGSSSGSPDPREARPHRTSPAPGDNRVSPATTALRRSNHQPLCASIPLSCACLRSGLSPGVFQSLTAPLRRDGPIGAIGTRASRRWRIQSRVRCLRFRIFRTWPTRVFTDPAVPLLECRLPHLRWRRHRRRAGTHRGRSCDHRGQRIRGRLSRDCRPCRRGPRSHDRNGRVPGTIDTHHGSQR